MHIQYLRSRFQITCVLTLCKFAMCCHAKNAVPQMHCFLIELSFINQEVTV